MADLNIYTENTPILKQQKSDIITNPLIIPKEIEESSEISEKNDVNINELTLSEINQNISESFLGLCNDLLQKPRNEYWNNYIFIILQKDNRYKFLLILIFFIFLFFILVKSFY